MSEYKWLKKLRTLLALLSPVQTKQQRTESVKLTTDCTDGHGLANQHPDPIPYSRPTTRSSLLPGTPLAHRILASVYSLLPTRYSLLISAPALLLLTAFNHQQGLGIAGLGIAAIIAWRLVEWKRSTLWWLIGGTTVINALFLWLYPRPAIIETYRAQGYLNAWYGFKIFTWSSPAAERTWAILGEFGLVNLAIGLTLVMCNRVTGWLTIIAAIVLSAPMFAVPFSELFAAEPEEVVVFHRMLFAIPAGLALTALLLLARNRTKNPRYAWLARINKPLGNTTAFILPAIAAVGLFGSPLQSGRTWQLLATTPDDLTLKPAWMLANHYTCLTALYRPALIISTCIPGTVVETMNVGHPVLSGRYNRNGLSLASDLRSITAILARDDLVATSGALVLTAVTFTSPASQAALLSHHWAPHDAFLATAGATEMNSALYQRGFKPHPKPYGIVFTTP